MIQSFTYKALTSVNAHAMYQRVNPPMGIVLMCHSIGQPSNDDFNPNGKWRISSNQLEMAINCATQMGFEAVSLDTIAQRLKGNVNQPPFYALTFDDGYVDNYRAALPVCQHYKVPMTVYVTTGFVQRKHIAWWHFIEHLIAHHSTLDAVIKGERFNLDCSTLSGKQKAFDQLSKILTLASSQDRAEFIEDMTQRYGENSRLFAESLFMNESELKEFAGNDYAYIGSHGVSHCAFSSLDIDCLNQELMDSAEYTQSLSNSQLHHLAYPYGSSATVSARDIELVKGQGIATAVTTQHGCITSSSQLQALPRIPLFPTDTEDLLKCKLSGLTTLFARWRDSIKNRELLG